MAAQFEFQKTKMKLGGKKDKHFTGVGYARKRCILLNRRWVGTLATAATSSRLRRKRTLLDLC